MPIELNPAGPSHNPDMLLGMEGNHTVFVPLSALSTLFGAGITSVATAPDYNLNVVTPIANAAALASAANTNANSRVKLVGPYADAASLQAAYPAAGNAGAVGLVGGAAPYVRYNSDGSAWIPSAAGTGTGTVTTVNSKTADGSGNVTLKPSDVGAISSAVPWNASTNVATPASPGAPFSPASSTIPAGGYTLLTVTVAGTTNLDGNNNWNVGDFAMISPAVGTWQQFLAAGYRGTFATAAALQSAIDAATTPGSYALVGSAAPYDFFVSNGTAWAKMATFTAAQVTALALRVVAAYATKTISANKTFGSADDGQSFEVTQAGLTLTFPQGMSWIEGVSIKLLGTTTFVGDGTSKINDSTASSTRAKGTGQRVVTVTPNSAVDQFDLSGT